MTQLTVIEKAAVALGTPEHEKALLALADKHTNIIEIRDQDSYKDCHSARMELKNKRVDLEKLGKAAREEAQEFTKAVIAEEKRLVGIIQPQEKRLQTLQESYDSKLEAERQAKLNEERLRIEAIQERLTELRGNQSLTFLSSPTLIAEHIADLQAIPVDASFAEFRQQAEDAKSAGLARLMELHKAAVEREAEQERIRVERAELEHLRAEQAKRDAEALERQRVETEQMRAKQEEEAREARAALAAERAKQDAEMAEQRRIENARIAAERAEREKLDHEAAERRAEENRRLEAEREALAHKARELANEKRRQEEEKAQSGQRIRNAAPAMLSALHEIKKLSKAGKVLDIATAAINIAEG